MKITMKDVKAAKKTERESVDTLEARGALAIEEVADQIELLRAQLEDLTAVIRGIANSPARR